MPVSRSTPSRFLIFGGLAGLLSVASMAVAQTAGEEGEQEIPFALPQSGPFTPAEIDIDNDQEAQGRAHVVQGYLKMITNENTQ